MKSKKHTECNIDFYYIDGKPTIFPYHKPLTGVKAFLTNIGPSIIQIKIPGILHNEDGPAIVDHQKIKEDRLWYPMSPKPYKGEYYIQGYLVHESRWKFCSTELGKLFFLYEQVL